MIVFVSSTYRNLAEHREVLRLALETSGYQFRGMEHFPAQERQPLDAALATMDDCDVYVGIVGELYGSSPPGRVTSYTELEYRRAEERGMYRILLVIADDAQINRLHVEDDPQKRRRLKRFRKHIMKQHTIQTFRDAHESAWKILAALRVYETRLGEQLDGGSM